MVQHPDCSATTPRPRSRLWDRFLGHQDGNITILFAFLLLPMLMMSGAALDYGMATRLETKLQAATDAAAILLCQTPLTATSTELNALAVSAMTGQMGAAGLVVDPLTITSNPRQIFLKTRKISTAFFGTITGTRSLNLSAQAQCATPVPKAFEIAIVLDNTGSMNSAGNDGVTKLTALKNAAKKFVSYVLSNPSFAAGTKIAIIPFSASVAVDPNTYRYSSWVDTQGQSPYHWGNFSGMAAAGFTSRFDVYAKLQAAVPSWKWAGCFESLPYPQNVTDMSTNGNASLYMPYLAPDEGGPGLVGNSYWNGSYSINSYIDDDDGSTSGSCPKLASNTSFAIAEGRACKYNTVRNPKVGAVIAELGKNGPNFGCTTQPLQRLTRDSVVLNTLIENMVAAGITNIHEGLMWGWRTISPKSVFADGTSYGSDTVGKIIVLMTDGANTWLDNSSSYNRSIFSSNRYFINVDGSDPDIHFPSSYQNVANGTQARKALDELTRQGCTNAKASPANITIYTIGFSVSSDPIDQQGINLLKDCASSPSQYFQANDSGSLIAAFNQIAANIGKLRLTK
ncbi:MULTISPECIES: TadE/TadG family type IV pilus assembly protein [Methylobacterium]|jgi:Flp pilus assembly protein TadG|uniref:TadE/TadG family type IV pilus assembly protein n=1 Tax=Methylobacterium TaxID=407 RepID=UPI0009F98313|nr:MULTISPECIES: TadE/TadG family type IV pilus assembly protein [Methylobacterium]NGM37390.1 pilus assembly protein [Methylobacterium sp. DB0501]UHC20259.1 Tad domain-containing protein [Methylobacterium currus]